MSEERDGMTTLKFEASLPQTIEILEAITPKDAGAKTLSKDQAERRIQVRRDNIFENWDTLKDILSLHEATIQTRWLKKTTRQRAKILLAAKPAMPAHHRPDFEAWRAAGPSHRKTTTATNTEAQELRRHAYLLPHINLQDLSKPQPLLLLLSSRKHHPSIFVPADREAMNIGVGTSNLRLISTNDYTMMLNGVEGRADYGRLVGPEEYPDVTPRWDRQQQPCPGEGLLILEAQDHLLQFLVLCCRQILHDIHPNKLLSETYPKKADIQIEELRIKTEQPQGGLWSLSDMALEAPYRVPGSLSLPKLEALLSAALAAAEDHLWSLRKDPSYFHETVLAANEHDTRRLKDTTGLPHPHFSPDNEHILWYHIIGQVILDGYLHLEMYSTLWQQSQRLQTLQKTHSHNISQNAPLPNEYLDAVLEFKFHLERATSGRLVSLGKHAIPSPHFRRFYERKPPEDPDATTDAIRRSNVKPNNIEDQLIWLVEALWTKSYVVECLGPVTFVDELQRLLDAEPTAAKMLTPLLTRDIGTLAILTDCLCQINMYHPWAMTFDEDTEARSAGLEQQFVQQWEHYGQIWAAFSKYDTGDTRVFSNLGKPTPGRFDYPAARRPTQENIEQMRLAEANLDALWAAADKLVRENADLRGTAIGKFLSEPRTLMRTPEWCASPHKGVTRDVDVPEISTPLNELYLELERRTTASPADHDVDISPSKPKVKTRGTPGPEPAVRYTKLANQRLQPSSSAAARAQQIIEIGVDARALKVFRTMFYQPSTGSTGAQTAWKDFVHALVSVGFAAQKLYGSVWEFTPSASVPVAATTSDNADDKTSLQDGEMEVPMRSIHFHESHPGKIPFNTARRHGRRLARAYGWEGSMFVAKEK